jgi:uncharacterized membrane protein
VKQTADLVPAWLPYRIGWACVTGAGQIACGLGVLFSVRPRVAARTEAGMISLFMVLVWGPAILAAPTTRMPWTAFFISWTIASAAWAVAQISHRICLPNRRDNPKSRDYKIAFALAAFYRNSWPLKALALGSSWDEKTDKPEHSCCRSESAF